MRATAFVHAHSDGDAVAAVRRHHRIVHIGPIYSGGRGAYEGSMDTNPERPAGMIMSGFGTEIASKSTHDHETDVRAVLNVERETTVTQIEALRGDLAGIVAAAVDANVDDEHDPEGVTIAFERAQTSALLAHAEDYLTQLDAALARLRTRSYGSCTSCGREIGTDRLLARPTATTCIACAQRRPGP